MHRSFKVDRFIQLFISDDPEPLNVSERALVRTFDWFAAAIRNGHMGIKPGVLRFPEDDIDAWKWLLFWIFYKEVPEPSLWNDCEAYQLVRCWCLGGKYLISAFQDVVMDQLHEYLDLDGPVQLEAIKDAFENSAPGSALREQMADHLVRLLEDAKEITYGDLDHFDGIVGFASAIAEALVRWRSEQERIANEWKECMSESDLEEDRFYR